MQNYQIISITHRTKRYFVYVRLYTDTHAVRVLAYDPMADDEDIDEVISGLLIDGCLSKETYDVEVIATCKDGVRKPVRHASDDRTMRCYGIDVDLDKKHSR